MIDIGMVYFESDKAMALEPAIIGYMGLFLKGTEW